MATRQVASNPYDAAGAAHQLRLDEVVREDFEVSHALPRQPADRAMFGKGLRADDRVVPQ